MPRRNSQRRNQNLRKRFEGGSSDELLKKIRQERLTTVGAAMQKARKRRASTD